MYLFLEIRRKVQTHICAYYCESFLTALNVLFFFTEQKFCWNTDLIYIQIRHYEQCVHYLVVFISDT